jgi:hypothetical protein
MFKYGIVAANLAFLATVAHADGDYISPTDDRVRLSLGVMHVSSSTDLQVDSSKGIPGTAVNAENQFGLDKSDFEPKFQAMVRVNERNRLWFDYFTLDRTGNVIVTEPIVFRDSVLQVGNPLQSQLNLRMLGITYGYSFWHGEKLEIAATLGITSVDIAATAKVETEAYHVDQNEDQAGPFPTPGLAATWVLSKRFYFDARAQYLNVHVHNLEGSLGFLDVDVLYRFRPNVSFALGYDKVKASLSSTQATSGGYFDFNSGGPEFFIRVSF